MHREIFGVVPNKSEYVKVPIFGYASRSVPGLSLTGLGTFGSTLKEKMIFISKSKNIKMPLNHYSICVETHDVGRKLTWDELKWLEFPALILYWSLANIISIRNLENCFSAGCLLSSGRVIPMPMGLRLTNILNAEERTPVWIGGKATPYFKGHTIDIRSLLRCT